MKTDLLSLLTSHWCILTASFYSHLFTLLYCQMNKLETILTTFMYIFIMYFYINVTFLLTSDKWNYLVVRLLNMLL